MSAVTAHSEYASWTTEKGFPLIEYSRSVLAQIDILVKAGFNAFRRGGTEVGGVLFGVHTDRGVAIHAFRPLASEYAFGPNFVLSGNDCAELDSLVAAGRVDPSLQGMVPVGWYHSHTRSPLHLSAQDIDIFNCYFPQRWQVALVMRPDKVAPTSAGFFFREPDGSIHSTSSYHEFPLRFDLMAPPRAAATQVRIPARIRRLSPPSAFQPIEGKWALDALVSGLVLALSYFLSAAQSRSRVPLSLTIEDRGNQIRISWDRTADAIRLGAGALLEIADGSRMTPIALQPFELRTGAVLYTRTSEHVVARMRFAGAEASASFAGQPVAAAGNRTTASAQPELREQADQSKAVNIRSQGAVRRRRYYARPGAPPGTPGYSRRKAPGSRPKPSTPGQQRPLSDDFTH